MTASNASTPSEKTRPNFPDGRSGIVTEYLSDDALLQELRALVGFFFPRTTREYVDMAPEAFRAIVLRAQEELNARDFARRLARDRRETICRILGSDRPLVQTNAYMRATRPHVDGVQENIGWHRESFYGPDMQESINFWVPIANVSAENAVRYIPDSHLIPDEDIQTTSEEDGTVERFSAGHKIGLLYRPKEIVSGVDLTASQPLVALPGEAAIFAGALIHGAAANHSDHIRFSVDFRMLAAESLSQGKDHFASGKSYFEPL